LHLLVPRGRNIARVGHVVHTSTRIDRIDVTTVLGVATTNATRTIVDLARIETSERLTTAIDSATRDRLTTDDVLLHRALALRTRGRGGIAALVDALNGIEITRGGHSWLEREFLRRCAAAGLPRPRTQQVLGRRGRSMIRVDCRFPDTPVVVELLGYAFHRTVIQMQNDAERMNRLTLDGHTVLQFTFTDVTERPDEVVALVTEALARHQ
jgi:very-short-patch-repair endonuclease